MIKWVLLPFVFLFVVFKNLFFKRDESNPHEPVKFKEHVFVVKQKHGKKEFIQ